MPKRYLIQQQKDGLYLTGANPGFEWQSDVNLAYRWDKKIEAETIAAALRDDYRPGQARVVEVEIEEPPVHKRRLIVTFELEVPDETWQRSEQQREQDFENGEAAEPLLIEIATYLACRVGNDNKPEDPYWLRDPKVYWIGEFMEAVAQGEVKTFEEDED